MSSAEREPDGVEAESGENGEQAEQVVFVDAATRVSNPSAFDSWYYGIEDKLGQGTVGMGLCLILFILVLVVAIFVNPI
jgi:hypothetical protein